MRCYYKRHVYSLLFILIPLQSIASEPALTFVQTHLGSKFQCAQQALTQAYKNLNMEVNFTVLPAKRALKVANDGLADGEMLRVAGIEQHYPNLIPIPVPLCVVESTIIASKKVEANNFKELKNYRFGIVAGFVHQENKVKEFNLNAVRVNKNEKLIELMLLDRVDAIFLSKKSTLELLNNSQRKEFKIMGFFSRKIYLYHYLNKKHKKIVPLITKELEQMTLNNQIDLEAHHL